MQSAFLPIVKQHVAPHLRELAQRLVTLVTTLAVLHEDKEFDGTITIAGEPTDQTEQQAKLYGLVPKAAISLHLLDKKTASGKGGNLNSQVQLAELTRGMPAEPRRLLYLSIAAEILRTQQPEISAKDALFVISLFAVDRTP